MFEEIEHFRMSIATSSSKGLGFFALVLYIIVTTRFRINDEVNNGDGDGDELMLSVAPQMNFPKELATQSFPCLAKGGLQTCIQASTKQGTQCKSNTKFFLQIWNFFFM